MQMGLFSPDATIGLLETRMKTVSAGNEERGRSEARDMLELSRKWCWPCGVKVTHVQAKCTLSRIPEAKSIAKLGNEMARIIFDVGSNISSRSRRKAHTACLRTRLGCPALQVG